MSYGKKMMHKVSRYNRSLVLGSWNIRTLVESSGDVHVCWKQQVLGERSNVVDRKLDMLVRELKRYRVSVVVARVQESRWFGKDIWPAADGYTFLHSGRPLPDSGYAATRNKGVGILLDEAATAAYGSGVVRYGKQLVQEIVMARLKWVGKRQRQSGGSRKSQDVFVTVICAYAPTARAPPEVKSKFSTELQDTLDKVSWRVVLVVLGDFNARVGVLKPGEEEWRGVVGKHGLDERNEAGEEFMQFCALNQLTVMNTWLQKKNICYGTWMYPATKQFHMIDLIMMRAKQRVCCGDVQVMKGANCWTNHKLVRAKLRLTLPHVCGKREKRMQPFSAHKRSAPGKRDECSSHLEMALQEEPHRPDLYAEENWMVLKSCIRSVAEKTIGRGKRKQPEWFEESLEVLMPLIEAKNDAHKRMLATKSVKARKEFRQQQRKVKRAVDQAREYWIRRVALEGEAAVKDGKTRWDCIRRLQQAYAGPSAVRKENGDLTRGPMEMLQR